MAATVDILEWNGTSGSQASTTKTSGTVRFKNADNATVDNNAPLNNLATNRSYEKWLRLKIGGTGPTGSITSPKFYLSGTDSTGCTTYIRTTNPGSYATPAVPANDTGGTAASTYTSGSPKALDVANAGPYTGTNTDIADFATMWMTVTTSATAPATTATLTLNFQYNET